MPSAKAKVNSDPKMKRHVNAIVDVLKSLELDGLPIKKEEEAKLIADEIRRALKRRQLQRADGLVLKLYAMFPPRKT
jgi:hypothetical protein